MSPGSLESLLLSPIKPSAVVLAWAWVTDHPGAWRLILCGFPVSRLVAHFTLLWA